MQSHKTHCSHTQSVNVIRAGKLPSTWKVNMELDMDVDMEGCQNPSSVLCSNSQSNDFPSFPGARVSTSTRWALGTSGGRSRRARC